jgi:hypothetical protein
VSSGGLNPRRCHVSRPDHAQQEPQPPEQEAEVVTDGSKDDVDGIAGAVREVIASHAMLGFEMSDHGLEIVAATRKWPIQPHCSLGGHAIPRSRLGKLIN